MFYIHGGGLTGGSGSDDNYAFMAQHGVVSVSINYRLNAFGFMALKEISLANDNQFHGNWGFMDQILALKVRYIFISTLM